MKVQLVKVGRPRKTEARPADQCRWGHEMTGNNVMHIEYVACAKCREVARKACIARAKARRRCSKEA